MSTAVDTARTCEARIWPPGYTKWTRCGSPVHGTSCLRYGHPDHTGRCSVEAGCHFGYAHCPVASGNPPTEAPGPVGAEPTREQVNTYTEPDLEARRDVRHEVLAHALRHAGRRAPADRIWGRFYGQGPEVGAKGNVWAGDPEDVADVLIRALWAAEQGT